MLNDRWARRMLRAAKTEVVSSDIPQGIIEATLIDRECEMKNCVKDHEKIMEYLQKDNNCGHAHNLDMLINSLNLNQHLREAFWQAEVTEDPENNCYVISFPFGVKTIEYKLSMKAVDAK